MYDLAIMNVRRAGAGGLWNIGIEDGKITEVSPSGSAMPAKECIEADGLTALPGLIDAHVHTRDPGYTYKEDFRSAAEAAAAGGITTIMAMPNSNPPLTNAAALEFAQACAKKGGIIDIRFVGGAVTAAPSWMRGFEKNNIAAIDVYDDPYTYGSSYWSKLFLEAKKLGKPLCFYLMDPEIERRRRAEYSGSGADETEVIINATNGFTESMSICRIFPMAVYFDCPVVLRMVSTAAALDCIRNMRRMYPTARVYVEVCVHYMFLSSGALKIAGSRAHIHPPLRSENDMAALWEGVKDGTVDYIASDHAPHAMFEKERNRLSACASGMTGLETMLPLLLTACSQGRIKLEDIQRLCCESPARIYRIEDKGRIEAGNAADVVLIDTRRKWKVEADKLFSRGAPSPFCGMELTGKPVVTISGGQKIYDNGMMILNSKE